MGDVDSDGLQLEFGSGSDVKVIARLSFRMMIELQGYGEHVIEVLGYGRIGLYLDLGFGCDVSGSVRLRFWFMVRCGCHRLATVWRRLWCGVTDVYGDRWECEIEVLVYARVRIWLRCEGDSLIELQDDGYGVAWLTSIMTGKGQVQ
ncbi:Ferm Domain-Containing Protein 4B [Manis pentadactyla]|nr:Ferm Domain-Containing Protein 4B [Manis pentadactyla]